MLYTYNVLAGILFAAVAFACPLDSPSSGCKYHELRGTDVWQINLYEGINCNEAAPGTMPSNIFQQPSKDDNDSEPCMQTYGGLTKAESFVFSVSPAYYRIKVVLNFYEEANCKGKGYSMGEGATIQRGAPMLSPVDAFYKKHFNGNMPKSFKVSYALRD
ncbi:hypothetical protein BJ138DRAFT_1166965, partial [Hygrophoropsis aurantiaca]